MVSITSRIVAALVVLGLVAGCGGGTSPSAQAEAVTTKTLSMTAQTVNAAGAESNRFEEGQAFELRVLVRETTRTVSQGRTLSESTAPAANATVAATVTGAEVQPPSALTGSDGTARFRVVAGQNAGAFAIELSTTAPGAQGNATARLPFMIESVFRPDARIELTDANGAQVGAVRPGQPVRVAVELRRARITALGLPDRYEPAAGIRVGFSAEAGTFDPALSAATTDASGRASILFFPPVRSGGLRLSATAEVEGRTVSANAVLDVRVPQIYLGIGQPFQPGVLSVDPPEIEAGASARVSAFLVDEDGRPFEEPLLVDFVSACAANDAATLVSPVLAAGGVVATSYTAGPGCLALDVITADFLVPGLPDPVRAQAAVRIRPPLAEGITYVEASHPNIVLRGLGSDTRPERSEVTFRVTNAAGVPVSNALVDFVLLNALGELAIEIPSATTDVNGLAVTQVRAGDVPGVFRIRATVRSTGQTTDSATLSVSTGRADQDSFSLSFQTLNIEGWNFDGATTTVTVRAGDRLNNPVSDGTAIYFTAEGGLIDAECRTIAGACSVNLRSSNPRPADGRVTVLARTEGTESWVDLNGNGLYDAGEPFTDLGEAFRDDNEDGQRNPTELFFDANGNGLFDGPNGRLDGGPCAPGVVCGRDFEARASGVVVFSTSPASISVAVGRDEIDELSPTPVLVWISDRNGNLSPAGTQVEVAVSRGTLTGEADYTVLNTNARGPLVLPFSLLGDGSTGPGTLTVRVTTPRGVVTSEAVGVRFRSACEGAVLPRPPSCAGGGVATVASVTVTPETVAVGAGTSRRENVEVRILGQATPPAPIRDVTPSVSCNGAGATDLSVTVPDGVMPTNESGVTVLGVEIAAGSTASGSTVCTIAAGGVSTSFTVVGPPIGSTTAGTILLTPTTITAQANATTSAVVLVTVRNAATPAAPLAGVTPALRCTAAGASGLAVSSGTIVATNAAGQTEIPLSIVAGATPSGRVECEVTSGAARATFAVQG